MNTLDTPDRFAIVDENGWIVFDNRQIEDAAAAKDFFAQLHYLPNRSFASQLMGERVIVEAFDSPLVVQSFRFDQTAQKIVLVFSYNYTLEITAEVFTSEFLPKFFLDPWDRIYGETKQEIPFSFSKTAYGEFFDSLDEFDDDSVVFNGQHINIQPIWQDETQVESADWWNQAYTGEIQTVTSPEHQKSSGKFEVNPGWNMDAPAETLKSMLPRMKLPKSRILILGCGDSHDAAFFAENGHKVTAVDISPHAIERSKKLYGHLANITWVQADVFKLPENFNNSFDLVYEYTCFCAINPKLRNNLVQVWSRCLHEQGQLMATLFCMHKRTGPPFGGTEWEYRETLKKRFQTLLWSRWRKSNPRRQGRELFILAQKRKLL